MTTRFSLKAIPATLVGSLVLLAIFTVPAFAWHSNVEASAACDDYGTVTVHYKVSSWEPGNEGSVDLSYLTDDGSEHGLPPGTFGPGHDEISGTFTLPAGSTGTVQVKATVHWSNGDTSTDYSNKVDIPKDCGHETTTTEHSTTTTEHSTTTTEHSTTTTEQPTTTTEQPTTTTEAPTTTTEQATTTTSNTGVLPSETSRPSGPLPFTGANSIPMLLGGLALVAIGLVALRASKARTSGK